MRAFTAIIAYECFVEGSSSGGVDYQTRYFEFSCEDELLASVKSEPVQKYVSAEGKNVEWRLNKVLAIRPFTNPKHGDEIIGFTNGKILDGENC